MVQQSKKCSNFFQRQHVNLQTAVQKCWCGGSLFCSLRRKKKKSTGTLRLGNEADYLSSNQPSEAVWTRGNIYCTTVCQKWWEKKGFILETWWHESRLWECKRGKLDKAMQEAAADVPPRREPKPSLLCLHSFIHGLFWIIRLCRNAGSFYNTTPAPTGLYMRAGFSDFFSFFPWI